ncbi:HAMP domain-containing sensor histidine kinase [Anaerotignum lactatifermentans]|uniref:HAMP domain-containing sensor histidine kinase n=1 Tax=Anaerotignum lactatifermentans TaxID=160404 RepID=UPI0024B23254|nr:HAMP domain-containing sensor histidine kinase [Anaerotignum lactatifermentans]
MKRVSIKLKITIWYFILMTIMSVLMIGFLWFVSNAVTTQTAMNNVSQVVRSNLDEVDVADGKLQLGNEFQFYQNGVYTVIYSQKASLLAGQIPASFTVSEPFENGLTRMVSNGENRFYVFDLWCPFGWDDGVWVRGVMEVSEDTLMIRNLVMSSAAAMPIFILLATIGGYLIAKRAFRPLEQMIQKADTISEASDLSARMEIPEGNNEFTRLATTFDKMFERLEKSFEAEQQFTADASHELRTPTSVIKSACEYAKKYEETPEERAETIEMIYRQAVKMSDLISELLSITRLDQGTESVKFAPVNFADLIHKTCEENGYDLTRFHFALDDTIILQLDMSLMGRLVQNLVENAIKYGKPDGQIWIKLEQKGNEVLFHVQDDGIGIAKEEQEKIWKRFYQVDASRTGKRGAGLGLSMVQKIAELHHGYMELESTPGKGSTFTLHLPASQK